MPRLLFGKSQPSTCFWQGILICLPLLFFAENAPAFEFGSDKLDGSFDTTASWGLSWRVQDQDQNLIGIANGGNRYSVNTDDGNQNYDKGLVSNVIKLTHDLDLKYQNYGAFVRVSYFHDFHNHGNDDLVPAAERKAGNDFDLLDAYLSAGFDIANRALDLRLGNQVVSWGESTFIQNSINVLNPVDVRKLRIPGAELREALVPVPMLWASQEINKSVSFEAVILTRFDHVEIDPRGTYFSTNDFASIGGENVVTGFGQVDDDSCPHPNCIPRGDDRKAGDSGQYGVAFRYFADALNSTEFGLFYINYHSRLPLISANAATVVLPPSVPSSAQYFVEYPEDIKLYGLSFNTLIGGGIALQGEISQRKDVPLQVEDVEVLLSALCHPLSQLGACPNGLGGEVSGFIRRDVTQVQFTATDSFGASNLFRASQWILLGEVGLNRVSDMPDKNSLRLEGPGTSLPADATVAAGFGIPQQEGGYPDATSWGYRILSRWDYNNAFASINLSPLLAFAHDVNGTSPGPGGSFIEGRKALTVGLNVLYLNEWNGGLRYTRYSGAEKFNLIHDRDFVSLTIKYSF